MCLGGRPKPVAPPPPVAPAPTREQIAADAAANKIEMTNESKKKVKARQGLFSNILTTTMGDPLYGQQTASYAAFGGRP